MQCIVYTRPDGGVSVCAPSSTALRYMTTGGGRWDGFPVGFLDRQIAEQAKFGVGESAAHRFVMAMQFGGCTDAEAFDVMRDRYCAPHGSGFEVWIAKELPGDRWFRDAWRRSHNGGPIEIDMVKARKIHLKNLKSFAKARKHDLQWPRWRERLRRASSPEELRSLWPEVFSYG